MTTATPSTAVVPPADRLTPVARLWQRIKPFAQLVRLPNVFTAFADIGLAGLAAGVLPERWLPFTLVLLASGCLYAGGMVWNDFFDFDQDYRERPFRPLPSGKIRRATAALLGSLLLAIGVGCAAGAGGWALSCSLALLVCILLYDGWLKHTSIGPIAMGACRFFNVLLGLSAAERWVGGWGLQLALVVGIYIVGVTWFARTEARISKQGSLRGAAFVMLIALVLALPLPAWLDGDQASTLGLLLYPYLLVGFGFALGFPLYQAIAEPTPSRVQTAVKRSIMGLVVLDAILATALAGLVGLLILVLLVPALFLGRWIYST
jgi:UbiA prenyltransferase family protein